jgi:hypothetical protein
VPVCRYGYAALLNMAIPHAKKEVRQGAGGGKLLVRITAAGINAPAKMLIGVQRDRRQP